jgi:hypothetical protein
VDQSFRPNPTGATPLLRHEGSLHVYDPFGYYVQIASAEAENAFRR